MAPRVSRIPDIPNVELGEGPHWDVRSQCLYFVDIFGKSIHKYVPLTRQHTKAVFDKPVSIIIPLKEQTDQFVVTLEREISIVTWDGVSVKTATVQKIAEVDPGTKNRINDGKCDPRGRLFAGTMGPEHEIGHYSPQAGTLYSLSNGVMKSHASKIGISNGLAWNLLLGKFYYIDSLAYSVDEFNYDVITGNVSNRRSIFSFKRLGMDGFPDGMTIDEDGNLWLAVFNGYKVIQIDPRKTDTLLQSVEIPAKQVTSVAWGGPNLDILYVTSASFTVDGEALLPPNHGAIFEVIGLGTKGLPANDFVL
ncbi:regucalcin-like [Euwallacea fornicatus]|uniref:regucalcin-like n=1 Tax=Euwallacea fornicatus TaxID=995702 RepID=UPI00338F7A0A